MLTFLLQLSFVICALETIQHDYPYIKKLEIKKYTHEYGENFRMITYVDPKDIPEITEDYIPSFFVGGREYLYRFPFHNINKADVVYMPREAANYERCMNLKIKDIDNELECHNQVWSVSYTTNSRIIVCESQSFRPKLRYLNRNDLSENKDKIYDGIEQDGYVMCNARASKQPGKMLSHQYRENNKDWYIAFLQYDYRFVDSISSLFPFGDKMRVYKSSVIRSIREKSIEMLIGYKGYSQFHEPIFKSSIEIGDYIYLFYTDSNIWSENYKDPDILHIANKRFSRVARFCKNDPGWESNKMGYMISFRKSIIDCASNNSVFDMIEDVVFDGTHFYATFHNSLNKNTSAICKINLSFIDGILNGPVFNLNYSPSDTNYSYSMNITLKDKCSTNLPDDRSIQYLIRCTSVFKSIRAFPHIIKLNITFNNILLTKTKSGIIVLFVFDDQNYLYKYTLSTSKKLLLSMKYEPIIDQMINDVRIHDDIVYGIGDSTVFSFKIEQCKLYSRCVTCSVDAHCMWYNKTCVPYDASASGNKIQNIGEIDAIEGCKDHCNCMLRISGTSCRGI